VLGVCVALSAAPFAVRLLAQGGTLLQKLSVSESNAQNSFFDVIWDGSPYVPGGRDVFKAAAPAVRVTMVRGLAAMLKAYTRSDVFKARYTEYVDANRPRITTDRTKSGTEQDAETDASIKEMEANIKKMPPEMQKQMEEVVKAMKMQQAELKKNTEFQEAREAAVKQGQAQEEREFQERLAQYESEHPKNPDLLIASRLKQFLALSADVNFDAKLVKQGDKMRFEDPTLEAKPEEWKLCFRAGREATDAARAFAAEWLKELRGKTPKGATE
jgi:hypothetical protein